MVRRTRVAWSAILTVVLTGGIATAQVAGPVPAPPARVARATASQSLVSSAASDPAELVRDYLRSAGHAEATVASMVLASRDTTTRTGVTHLRFVQRAGGLDVYGTYVKASVGAAGDLLSVIENLVAASPVTGAALAGGEGRALAIGLRHIYGDALVPPGLARQQGNTAVFTRTPFFHREPTVTRVAVPAGAALRLGYLVETWSERGNQLHHTVVGGDGAVLGVELRTNSDSYNVFTKDPGKAGQVIVNGPGEGNSESPSGWLTGAVHKTTDITGNNVRAYLDTDADNAPDAGGQTAGVDFLAEADLQVQPSTAANQAVATQNLFYLNNVLHDRLYFHGFTEGVGNFQETNFTGAIGDGDSVLAEVQDGSGTDNANFATPNDGSNPRMQMFLWSGLGTHEVAVGGERYLAQGAAFGPSPDAIGISYPLAVADDGVNAGGDACDRFPRNALAGAIAIVDRGSCDFTVKVTNAQRAGALGVIVANNVDGAIFTMGGSANTRIPAVMVSRADGLTLKALVQPGPAVTATMRLADPAPLSRDSSLDSEIVYHEYGHGLTWRMIGGMTGAMSGAIGEGMSDVLSLLLSNEDTGEDDVVAEYSAGDALGIRSAPYDGYLRTYGDFSATSVHFDGEIYAAIGWQLRKNFLAAGADTNTLLGYLVDGMNFTVQSPAFEDMRDGILAAIESSPASAGTTHACLVWSAFAKFGVGEGATSTVRRNRVNVTESETVPASCGGAGTP